MAVDAFKDLGDGVGAMRPKEENVIDKTQPEAGFFESGDKEILFKETYEEASIGRGHMCDHVDSLNLEVMPGVKGEMVVGEDKLGKLDNHPTSVKSSPTPPPATTARHVPSTSPPNIH